MAHHKSALKRIDISAKQRDRNRYYRSQMRTAVKNVRDAEDQDQALLSLKKAYSVIDRLVSKGILNRNNAANKKSGLTKLVNGRFAS